MTETVRALLGDRATRVVRSIADPLLASRVVRALDACADTLQILDAFDLTQHESPNGRAITTWGALAPHVGRILVAIQRTHDQVVQLFPSNDEEPLPAPQEVDIDQAFDSITGESADWGRVDRSKEIDRVVHGDGTPLPPARLIERAVSSLTTMLQKDIYDFREQLKIPAVLGDPWSLIAELHEFKGKCTQCLEAVVAAMVGPFTSDAVETLLPRYSGAVTRALVLRSGLVDLAFEVERKNQLIQAAGPEETVALWSELLHDLEIFAGSRAYKLLRPSDKKEVFAFRVYLSDWAKRGADVVNLRMAMEGFSRFLDFRRKINRREELVGHDKSHLERALAALEGANVSNAVEAAGEAYGRFDVLDEMIREAKSGSSPTIDALRSAIHEALVPLNL
ncbi:MAG: hypothetical protein HY791_39745 [Deltaproteobacteria bacterium]|nr:hypothetical protein [Deltaproteobacteria bacterium]